MVDWKWRWLQERSHSLTNSDKMLEVSAILLRRRGRVDFWRGGLKFLFSKFVVQVYRLRTRRMLAWRRWAFRLHRCNFWNDRLQKTSWCFGGSSSNVLCNRVVPQKSAKDSCKNDEIAVDSRSRHWDTRSKRPLGNNGGVVGGREISSAALRKYREDL